MGEITTKNFIEKLVIVAVALICVFFCVVPAFAQEKAETAVEYTELQQKENESFGSMFQNSDSQNSKSDKSPSTFWMFFRTLIVLALVIVAIYFIFRFVKKTANPSGNETDPFLKKVASLSLATGKSVQVVTLDSHCYVLGVGDDSVELISELDPVKDKDIIDAMNLHQSAEPTQKRKDFASMLSDVMGFKKKNSNQSFAESLNKIKSQSSRLKKSSLNSEKGEGGNEE